MGKKKKSQFANKPLLFKIICPLCRPLRSPSPFSREILHVILHFCFQIPLSDVKRNKEQPK